MDELEKKLTLLNIKNMRLKSNVKYLEDKIEDYERLINLFLDKYPVTVGMFKDEDKDNVYSLWFYDEREKGFDYFTSYDIGYYSYNLIDKYLKENE